MDWLPKLLSVLKLPARLVIWFFLVSAVLLLLPKSIVTSFGLVAFREAALPYAAGVLICSSVLLSIDAITAFARWSMKKLRSLSRRRKLRRRLLDLDPSEQAVLREYALQDRNTLDLPIDEATVSGLLRDGVLQVASSVGQHMAAGMVRPLSLSPVARKALTSEHLGLPEDLSTLAQSDEIALDRLRPAYVESIRRTRSSQWL